METPLLDIVIERSESMLQKEYDEIAEVVEHYGDNAKSRGMLDYFIDSIKRVEPPSGNYTNIADEYYTENNAGAENLIAASIGAGLASHDGTRRKNISNGASLTIIDEIARHFAYESFKRKIFVYMAEKGFI